MQDIGGCRAVVSSVENVRLLRDEFHDSGLKHELLREYNYLDNPRSTGYRSWHLVYKYYSDKSTAWNDLRIEVQIRSPLQHAWATAVETVGAFSGFALKANEGDAQWRRFFALMGTEMAFRERTALVPETPNSHTELIDEIRDLQGSLDVVKTLKTYRQALRQTTIEAPKGSEYFLIIRERETVSVRAYRGKRGLESAYQDYEREESASSASGIDKVLVRVESLAQLQRAYPNYFFDTEVFLNEVSRVLV